MNGKVFLFFLLLGVIIAVIRIIATSDPYWLWAAVSGLIIGLLMGVLTKKEGPPIRHK